MVKPSFYCRYCASTSIIKANYKTKDMMDKTLEPEISVGVDPNQGIGKLTLKGGHISKIQSDELTIDTTYCKVCRNLDAGISARESLHFEMNSSKYAEMVVIPHALSVAMKSFCVESEEIVELVNRLRSSLGKIYQKWQPTGRNPCKKNKTGRKLEFEIKHGFVVKTWIIIDSIKDKIVFRLSYGGGNVKC